MKAYNEASGGLRWKFRPLSVDVGYRYMQMEGKTGVATTRWPMAPCRRGSELLTLKRGLQAPFIFFCLVYSYRRQHAAGDAQLNGDHRHPADKHQRQRRRTAPDAILCLMFWRVFHTSSEGNSRASTDRAMAANPNASTKPRG